MKKPMKRWVAMGIVAFACLSTAYVVAQQDNTAMTADRSRAVLRQLEVIDADRAGFVNQLLGSWAPYVDYQDYDLYGEIADAAMRVPAWQLYGASLTGDFHTMLRVLTGEEGAGHYIGALAEPEGKSSPDLRSSVRALGDLESSLVYTPIAPCRLVDTRNAGAKTGILVPGVPRNFDLEAQGLTSGQGGNAVCAGLPGFSHKAWAVNVTVVSPTDVGFLRIWPYEGTQPTASVINFWNTAPNSLANAMNVTGCYGCAEDIVVQTFGPSVHVVIDVVGYYQVAGAPASTAAVTAIAGTVVSLAAGAKGYVDGGLCPAGTLLIGGQLSHGGFDLAIGESEKDPSTNNWRYWMINNDAGSRNVTAYSQCLDTPMKPW